MSKCVWTYDQGAESWDTSCKHNFTLNEGTPKENNMKFCCYCGKELHEYVPANDD